MCIAALCAAATMLLVTPDSSYFDYIDLRVLCLLACLMAVVAGFQSCGAFEWLAVRLLRRGGNGTALGVALVLLPFFASMLVTNDVALLTFVPFTLLVLEELGCRRCAVWLVVLQTLAANLGSMATPVGNPQNLFLYGAYRLSPGAFFSAMLPLTGISLVCLTVAALPALPRALHAPQLEEQAIRSPKKLVGYGVLFALCLLTVFRVLPFWALTALVLVAVALMEPKLLRGLDYGLLATFVCFFIVSGNLGRVAAVRTFLQGLLERSTLLTAVLTSQVISNVPAAVLLSGFTDDWCALLEGVNIGGLGTPIASLASLISMKLYFRTPEARPVRYLLWFTLANLAGLAILLLAAEKF
ncbi:MAG: SLC13 family permease [Oscillibacter sp.]|nr:SLC13 family permease [Oscillibacter sp.]